MMDFLKKLMNRKNPGQDNPYAKQMRKIASATPEQVAKMSAKKKAIYFGAVSWLREQDSAAANLAAQASSKAEIQNQASVEIKTARIAAARARTSESKKITPGQVAAFIWMPQIGMSLKSTSFAITILVQIFAQILISIKLLPPDHPARNFSGAKAFRLFPLLEEARASLPTLKSLWIALSDYKQGTRDERILAVQQHVVFASVICVLVSCSLTVIALLANLAFGTAQAFAQPVSNPSPSGQGYGAYPIGTTSNLGLGFINAIFDPGNNSIVGSGLGALFSLYSTTVLVFAGLILIWIIISSVAETARTGIPFGKQFNHVWAPIRLVAALGLLVPLGSGLNSGQYMVINLAKWGSTQADTLWQTYANKAVISPGGTSGNVANALSSIPVTKDANRAISDQLFDIMLCQALYNQYQAAHGQTTTLPAVPTATIVANEKYGSNVAVLNADGSQSKTLPSNDYVSKFSWQIPGQVNCGSANFPQLSPATGAPPGTQAAQDILNSANTTPGTYANLAGGLASRLAKDAVTGTIYDSTQNPDDYINDDMNSFMTAYSNVANAYAEGRASSIAGALQSYNKTMGIDFTQDAKNRGWVSAPVWLNQIAAQNGRVLDTAQIQPLVLSPQNSANGGPSLDQMFGGNRELEGQWNLAQDWLGRARQLSGNATASPMQNASALLQAVFGKILQPNNNPLGSISSFGRQLMSMGVIMTFEAAGDVTDSKDNKLKDFLSGQENEDAVKLINKNANAYRVLSGGSANNNTPATLLAGNSGAAANQTLQGLVTQTSQQMKDANLMRPAGSMLISFGFMSGYVLPLLPYFRFMLGVLGWMLLLFEAILAMPLLALSLLKTDGEGFMTQNFQTGVTMILALIIRPALMIFGLLFGLIAFNSIMNIVNISYLVAIGGTGAGTTTDNSLLSTVIYLVLYGILAYTLANSAFKAIDILPNQVMSWLGARLDQRVDDASTIQQQTGGIVQNLGMVSAFGRGHQPTKDELAAAAAKAKSGGSGGGTPPGTGL